MYLINTQISNYKILFKVFVIFLLYLSNKSSTYMLTIISLL